MSGTPLAITPKRREFLRAAIEGQRILWNRPGHWGGGVKVWAGGLFVFEGEARKLAAARWIEPVPRADGRPGVEPGHRSPNGYVLSHLYRVTAAGKEAAQ